MTIDDFIKVISERILKRFNFGFELNPYVSRCLNELNEFNKFEHFEDAFYNSSSIINFIVNSQWTGFVKAFRTIYNELDIESEDSIKEHFSRINSTIKKINNKITYDKYISII